MHRGFLQRARAIPIVHLYAEARRRKKRLVLCGHSLGGAVAAVRGPSKPSQPQPQPRRHSATRKPQPTCTAFSARSAPLRSAPSRPAPQASAVRLLLALEGVPGELPGQTAADDAMKLIRVVALAQPPIGDAALRSLIIKKGCGAWAV